MTYSLDSQSEGGEKKYCFALLLVKFQLMFTFLCKTDFACNSAVELYEDCFLKSICVDGTCVLLVTNSTAGARVNGCSTVLQYSGHSF